jgi:hypothetical protein
MQVLRTLKLIIRVITACRRQLAPPLLLALSGRSDALRRCSAGRHAAVQRARGAWQHPQLQNSNSSKGCADVQCPVDLTHLWMIKLLTK